MIGWSAGTYFLLIYIPIFDNDNAGVKASMGLLVGTKKARQLKNFLRHSKNYHKKIAKTNLNFSNQAMEWWLLRNGLDIFFFFFVMKTGLPMSRHGSNSLVWP